MPAQADDAVSPASGSYTITGAGYGHGWGMSQYGAYGAATKGLSWKQIVAFYYPGTTVATQRAGSTIKVWISADKDNDLRVAPAPGLKLTDTVGKAYLLPAGTAYTAWRVTRSGTGQQLHYRDRSGVWTRQTTPLGTGTWTFADTAKIIRVQLPSGAATELRGTVAFVKTSAGGRTVNRLTMEDYLKSVVPSEMPTSWAAEAVRTQAVAARTYAARLQAVASVSTGYDVCDTTACQVYRGYASVSAGGSRTNHETSGGNAAVQATAGAIVKYGSAIALTQFSSSNGGHSARGDFPYLSAHADPYDGVVTSNAWTKTVTATAVGRVWPSVGTVRQLQVSGRDGAGRWGGRVTSIKIIGSAGTVSVSGASFRSAFGMRSTLFTVTGASSAPPSPPTVLKPGPAYATFPRTYDRSSRADLLMINSAGKLLRYPVGASGTVGRPTILASGFGGYTNVVNAGDWNGDGYQDVIARTATKRLLLFRGRAGGGLAAGVDMLIRSNHVTITSVGDVNGDRYPDLAVINDEDRLYLIYGNGRTGYLRYTRLASGWGARQWMRGPGDLTGDRRPDLVTRVGDRLYLHKGTATSFRAPVTIGGSGWAKLAAITSIGDFDGDTFADIVGRTTTGRLVLYRGNGKGGLSTGKILPGSYTGLRFVV